MTTMDVYTEPLFDSAALLTIDMQRDLLDGEPFCVPGTSEVLPQVTLTVEAFRATGRPLVHLVGLHGAPDDDLDGGRPSDVISGRGMLQTGSAGSQLAPGVVPGLKALDADMLLSGQPQEVWPHESVVYRPRWGAFFQTPLEEHLADCGVTTVVVAGCDFPHCPRTTVYEALELDYRVVLVTDAVSGLNIQWEQELAALGVALMTAEEVVAALLEPILETTLGVCSS